MIFTITKRGEGKTSKALSLLATDPDAVLIVPTERRADDVRRAYRSRYARLASPEELRRRIFTMDDAMQRGWRRSSRPVIIDDLDAILHNLLHGAFFVQHVFASGELEALSERES